MSKTILITLNNSGNDAGPYNLTLIDSVGNETAWSSNPVTKPQLTAGYQMTVADNIVKVKVQSETCTSFIELIISTTQCPCRKFNFKNGTYQFYECGKSQRTDLFVGATSLTYCVNTLERIIVLNGPGDYVDTQECCTPSTPPVVTPSTTTTTTTTSTSTTTTSTTTTSTTTTSTTTTTTTCAPGKLFWGINEIVGARIKITRVNDGAVLVDQLSLNGPYSGTINNNLSSNSYLIEGMWNSGSGQFIKMRICDVANTTEYSFDSGSGPGTDFSHTITINPCGLYSVYVTAGVAIPPPCPI